MDKVILAILVIYTFHWFLATKTKIAKKIKWLGPFYFRYFWNVVLFLTFMPTASSGILWYLGYLNRFLVNWHNQLGTVMVAVGVLRLVARIPYFLKHS